MATTGTQHVINADAIDQDTYISMAIGTMRERTNHPPPLSHRVDLHKLTSSGLGGSLGDTGGRLTASRTSTATGQGATVRPLAIALF